MREDLEKAVELNKVKFILVKGALKKIDSMLDKNEEVLFALPANMYLVTNNIHSKIKPLSVKDKTPGVFVITTKRVFHYNKILFNEVFEQLSIADINSVDFFKDMMASILKISGNTKIIELDIDNEMGKLALNIISSLASNKSVLNQSNVTINNGQGIKDKIKDLKSLLDEGLIDEEEYTNKKQELLNNL